MQATPSPPPQSQGRRAHAPRHAGSAMTLTTPAAAVASARRSSHSRRSSPAWRASCLPTHDWQDVVTHRVHAGGERATRGGETSKAKTARYESARSTLYCVRAVARRPHVGEEVGAGDAPTPPLAGAERHHSPSLCMHTAHIQARRQDGTVIAGSVTPSQAEERAMGESLQSEPAAKSHDELCRGWEHQPAAAGIAPAGMVRRG